MPYKLRSAQQNGRTAQGLSNNPDMQIFILELQEDLRGLLAYINELEERIETLENP